MLPSLPLQIQNLYPLSTKHNHIISLHSDWCIYIYIQIICDRILENSSKSHMKSSVFLNLFNDISTYAYVLTEYFLHSFSNLSIEFHINSAMKYY